MKFRGLSNGCWLYGSLVECNSRASILSPEKVDSVPIDHIGAEVVRSVVDRKTIGMYAKRLDRCGREIYEGDILRNDNYPFSCDDVKDNYFGVVEWDDEELMLFIVLRKSRKSSVRGISDGDCRSFYDWDPSCWEVIGNVHENPELLSV